MKRKIVTLILAVLLASPLISTQPVVAQGGGCQAFGQNIAFLAQNLGPVFGQTAAGGAPLNDTVEMEQDLLCD
jgi:hypothetical protein